MKHKKNINLREYTTTKIGGFADDFYEFNSIEDFLINIEKVLKKHSNIFVLGGGSNVLINDIQIKTPIISLNFKNISTNNNSIFAESGLNWDDFVIWALENNYFGIEYLSGIPGTLGGAVVQNIGAYGLEISSIVKKVIAFDIEKIKKIELDSREINFEYRDSLFKNNPKYIILSVEFSLKNIQKPFPIYKDLEDFEKNNPNSLQRRKKILNLRKSKGMLLSIDDKDSNSTGSFFTNPIIDKKVASKLKLQYPNIITFETKNEKKIKISAAWLIQNSGFEKGQRLNENSDIRLSKKHVLAITNYGNGSYSEVIEFATKIIEAVFKKFQIKLLLEPVVLTK